MKELKTLFDELEPEAYKSDYYCYPVKETNQIIRKHFEMISNNRTEVVKQILELIHNYGELDACPADEYEVNLDQICRALHSKIKKEFLL